MTDLLVPSSRPSSSPTSRSRRSVATRVVLDTSVLISDPESLFAFPDADAVIPLVVVEELDQHKTRMDDVGRAAREVIRTIEELRIANGGDIRHPVELPGGRHAAHRDQRPDGRRGGGQGPRPDQGRQPHPGRRARAAHARARRWWCPTTPRCASRPPRSGLDAIEHQRRRGRLDDRRPNGWVHLDVSAELIDRLFADPARRRHRRGGRASTPTACADLEVNQFAVLRAGSQSVLVRRHGRSLVPLVRPIEAWGLRPRSKEQQFALDLLCDPAVTVVALDGTAGTGKTMLALAAGLEQVMETNAYDKLSVYRPVVPVGKAELGFLPGSLDEKLDPWMTAVNDALVALTDTRSHADARALLDEMTSREKLSLEAVTYLRGRSLHGTYIVVDEAQNLEPTTLKTILTRIGEGTKVVFTGDTSQIDAPYLSEQNNAVSVLIDAFAGESCFGHVRLTHCERSEVASLAATRL